LFDHTPFFRAGEGRIDESFLKIEFAALVQLPCQPTQQLFQPAAAYPLLKTAVASLERRIPIG
jgi:hypothetical protein